MIAWLRECSASVSGTILRTFDFTGRSRRLEVGYFWIAAPLMLGLFAWVAGSIIEFESSRVFHKAIYYLSTVPFFALFVRRAHDQGRSGWWGLLLPPVIAANIYNSLRVNFHAFDPKWPALGYWHLVLIIFVILYMSIIIEPGTIGANRYGADPRGNDSIPVDVDGASGRSPEA